MRIALLASLFLLAACDDGKEAAGNRNQPVAAMTSAEREKQIEKAREEALAVLAARNANRQPAAAQTRSATRVLVNAQASPEALSRAFLRALARQDVSAIRALRLTKDEFCNYVFPELPASRVPNLTCDFTWDQASLRSLGGLDKMYPEHRGKNYELVAVRFAKGTETYPTYRVHKETLLTVRDERGREQEIRLFGSMLEMDGKYKLFSFVAD